MKLSTLLGELHKCSDCSLCKVNEYCPNIPLSDKDRAIAIYKEVKEREGIEYDI